MQRQLPKRIYKYRAFSSRVLDMLVADQLYFSDPADFNDPLDSRPNVEGDITDVASHLTVRMRSFRRDFPFNHENPLGGILKLTASARCADACQPVR